MHFLRNARPRYLPCLLGENEAFLHAAKWSQIEWMLQHDGRTDKQADRQTCRLTDRQTGRHADRQTDRQTDMQTDRYADRQTCRQTLIRKQTHTRILRYSSTSCNTCFFASSCFWLCFWISSLFFIICSSWWENALFNISWYP